MSFLALPLAFSLALALAFLATGPLAFSAVHRALRVRDLVHQLVHGFQLVELGLGLLQVLREFAQFVGRLLAVAVFASLCRLVELLRHFLQILDLLALLVQLVELLLQLGGRFGFAGGLLLLDLLFEFLFSLLEVVRRFGQLLPHLFELFGELFTLGVVQLAFLQVLLKLVELLQGLLHVALLHRLAELVGGPLFEILELFELLAHVFGGRQTVAALLQALRHLVEVQQGRLAIDRLLVLQLVRALLELLEEVFGVRQTALRRPLPLLFQTFFQFIRRLSNLVANLRGGRIGRLGARLRRGRVRDQREEDGSERRGHRQGGRPAGANREPLGNLDERHAFRRIAEQRFAHRRLAFFR